MNNINFICLRCNYECKNKYNFRKHFQRKKLCKIINRDFDVNLLIKKIDNNEYINFYNECNKQYKCIYCNKYYSSQSNMIRHRNNCNENNQIKLNNNTQIINNHITINQINNNQINQINQINNIKINNVGDEDLSKIDYSNLYFIDKHKYKYFCDKAENHIDNLSSILNDICDKECNRNYKVLNKREKKFMVKFENKEKITHLDNIQDYYNDLIKDTYHNHIKKENIEHYDEFIKRIDYEIRNFERGNKTPSSTQYYKLFNKIKSLIKDKLIWNGEENKKKNIF